MRKPYFIHRLKCWYVKNASGQEIRLDPDKDTAFDLWHEMSSRLKRSGTNATVLGVFEAFFDAHETELPSERIEFLERYASSFASHYPGKVSQVTKKQVIAWMNAPKPGRLRKDNKRGPDRIWSPSTRRDAGATVRRILRWAHGEGMIDRNPLATLRLEEPEPRSVLIQPEDHRRMVLDCMSLENDRSFALHLIACRCGARPQQIREVTAANVIGSTWVFANHKTRKKTKRPLVVYLSPCLQTLTKILATANPKGHLFRNGNGDQWKKDTVAQRMRRLRKRLKLPAGTIAYSYRHTYATNALVAGVHIATVAQLLGHTDIRMVAKVYSHLEQAQPYLIEAAAKVAAKHLK